MKYGRLNMASAAEQKLWRRIMAAWDEDMPACRHELSLRYTREYPDNVWGWVVLAAVLGDLATYDEAVEALRRGQSLAPPDERPKFDAEWGDLHAKKGELRRAIARYQKAIEAHPTPRVFEGKARCAVKLGEYAAAKDALRRAIRLYPEDALEAHHQLGQILRGERKYDAAVGSFERALELEPDDDRTRAARDDALEARALKSAGKQRWDAWSKTQLDLAWDDERWACCRELAVRLTRSDERRGWGQLATSLEELARYEEAEHALENLLRVSPRRRWSVAYRQLGWLWKTRGNQVRAAGWFQKAIDLDPSNGLLGLGTCMARQGDYAAAKRCQRRAIRFAVGCTDEAYLNLGYVLRAERRYPEARECFERAIELDPCYADAKLARKDVIKAKRFARYRT